MGPPLGVLPLHRSGRFPRSTQEPALGSRTPSCRPSLGQSTGSPRIHPGPTTGVRFRWHPYAFDTSSAIHFRSSSQRSPDGFIPPFPDRSPPWPLGQRSIRRFGPGSCNPSPRGQPPSLMQQGCVQVVMLFTFPRRRAAPSSSYRSAYSDYFEQLSPTGCAAAIATAPHNFCAAPPCLDTGGGVEYCPLGGTRVIST